MQGLHPQAYLTDSRPEEVDLEGQGFRLPGFMDIRFQALPWVAAEQLRLDAINF